MKFTDEQQWAIDHAARGGNFSLVAPAGSGKSATALGIGKALAGKRILYMVYNRAARLDAEKKFANMPWVDVRTTSQIAWREYAKTHAKRMDTNTYPVPASKVAAVLDLKPKNFGGNLQLEGPMQVRLASDAIERFCNSRNKRITARDVPLEVLGVPETSLEAAREYIARLAWALWQQSIQPQSNLRFTMAHAFKLVAESEVDFGYDLVLCDEAQDSNDATMKFIENQRNSQIILIGDPAQALYGWRGASDQMLKFQAEKLFLTQSFRFGEAVAEEAMKHLQHTGTGVKIRGLPSIRDKVTDGGMQHPDVVLTRTNAGAMEWAMSYLVANKRVALVRGKDRILELAHAAVALKKGQRPANVELSAFETWGQLRAYAEEPAGSHLKPMVRLVDAYGVWALIDACKKMEDYDPHNPRHDVAISTCHSIKGLEWPNVQIGDDFFEPKPVKNDETGLWEPGVIDKNEAMIHYVAVTRAQNHLDKEGLSWVDKYEPAKASA